MTSICESCGRVVHIGDFPFCPHGRPLVRYRPFKKFFDRRLGKFIDSPSQWNRILKEGNWEVTDPKHDREVNDAQQTPSTKGFDRAYNEAFREVHGGVLPVGDILRDDGGDTADIWEDKSNVGKNEDD